MWTWNWLLLLNLIMLTGLDMCVYQQLPDHACSAEPRGARGEQRPFTQHLMLSTRGVSNAGSLLGC